MNKNKKIIIIGAGIAGLSAGCYARMNGFETEIFEQHHSPGGLCTGWKKQGYTFDGCIRALEGSAPPNSFHTLWSELGVIQGRRFIYPEALARMEGDDGREFILYTDPDKLEAHMGDLSPQDREVSAKLCRWIRKLSRYHRDVTGVPGPVSIFQTIKSHLPMLPVLFDLRAISQLNVGDFTARFKDPLIRETINNAMGKGVNLLALITTMASLANKTAGYPLGGSAPLIKAVEDRYVKLGGRIHYNQPVKELIIEGNGHENGEEEPARAGDGDENGVRAEREGKAGHTGENSDTGKSSRVTGVVLENGTQVMGDFVIWAGDLRQALDQLLEDQLPSPAHEELFTTVSQPPPVVQISFGLNRRYDEDLHTGGSLFKLDPPVTQGGLQDQLIRVRNYSRDPGLAPPGGSVITVHSNSDYGYWAQLRHGSAAYKAEVETLTWIIQRQLESVYPDFSEHVEVSHMVTPLDYRRDTNNHQGRGAAWVVSKEQVKAMQAIPNTIPDLTNFYLTGMGLSGTGGLHGAIKTSRDTMGVICQIEGRGFTTTMS